MSALKAFNDLFWILEEITSLLQNKIIAFSYSALVISGKIVLGK